MILPVVGLGVLAAVTATLLRRYHPELSLLVGVGASVLLLGFVLSSLSSLTDTFFAIAQQAGIESSLLRTVGKIIGVAYIGQLAAALCRDAGESAIATNLELCTKLIVLTMSMPILSTLFSILSHIVR